MSEGVEDPDNPVCDDLDEMTRPLKRAEWIMLLSGKINSLYAQKSSSIALIVPTLLVLLGLSLGLFSDFITINSINVSFTEDVLNFIYKLIRFIFVAVIVLVIFLFYEIFCKRRQIRHCENLMNDILTGKLTISSKILIEYLKITEKVITSKKAVLPNKYKVGPGMGLIILGLSYIIWWVMPFAFEAYNQDPRWAHNWAYAIIILTVGLSWYHKSPTSRLVATAQAFMLPVTASGSFNNLTLTYITIATLILWCVVVIFERMREKMFLESSLQKRTYNWLNLHLPIISWILIAHMALVFFIGRVPQEAQLLALGTHAGWLANFPPEANDFATIFFDISLIVLVLVMLYEQYKMGYNLKENPWPSYSFWFVFFCMAAGIIGVMINDFLV